MRKEEQCKEIIIKYYGQIYRYCLKLLNGDIMAAEDCTQDTFLLLFEKRDTLDFDNNIIGWLHATAELKTKSHFSKEKRRRSMIIGSIDEFQDISIDSNFIDEESVFDILSEEEYKLLSDYYSADYGDRTSIAKKYNLSTRQLYNRIFEIRKKLNNAQNNK